MNSIQKLVLGIKALARPSVAYVSRNNLLPGVIVRTPPDELRKLLLLPESSRTTQLNQDVFALLSNQFKAGYFVEIGANDGFTLSNTVYLEEEFGWAGLLVEANPAYQPSLDKRRAKSVIAAVVDEEGNYEFCNAGLYGGVVNLLDKTHELKTKEANTIKVWGTTLERILIQNNAPPLIDFISIDVEGAEVPIVKQMCSLEKFRFSSGCIEYNGRSADYANISKLLADAGYKIVWKGLTRHDLFFVTASSEG